MFKKATAEFDSQEPIGEKKKAAQESGRRGGLKGWQGKIGKLTQEKHPEITKKVALKRLEGKL